jgi:hypothetical protein
MKFNIGCYPLLLIVVAPPARSELCLNASCAGPEPLDLYSPQALWSAGLKDVSGVSVHSGLAVCVAPFLSAKRWQQVRIKRVCALGWCSTMGRRCTIAPVGRHGWEFQTAFARRHPGSAPSSISTGLPHLGRCSSSQDGTAATPPRRTPLGSGALRWAAALRTTRVHTIGEEELLAGGRLTPCISRGLISVRSTSSIRRNLNDSGGFDLFPLFATLPL